MSNLTTASLPKLTPPIMKSLTLDVVDYVIFAILLLTSMIIGVYFGFIRKSQNTTEEYLMGGRKMKVLPIAISLVASQLSGITMMAVPAEVYAFGINHIFNGLAMSLAVVFLCLVVLPVYYNNNLTTCYEYLELRYDRLTRKVVTFVFVMAYLFLFPIFNFLPSLAFSQVSHINTHVINTLVNCVCVFYTMIGGIRAVIWTDVVQGTIMMGTIAFVAFSGVAKVGGFSQVYNVAKEGGRLTPVSTVLFGIGFILVMVFTCLTGVIMYAYYHDCDPVLTGQVAKYDKLVPYFVQDILGHIKGVPGLFISGIFSAALSTVSAAMNSLSGVIYFEYIKPHIQHTESKANSIMKIIVCLFGVYGIFGGLMVEKFASIVQTIHTIDGMTFGAVFGVFTLGMLYPKAHGRAILTSMALSVAAIFTLIFITHGRVHYDPLPSSTDHCPANFSFARNETLPLPQKTWKVANPHGFNILNTTFNWYVVMGALIVIVAGIPLSYIIPAKKNLKNFDRKLLSPIVYPFVKYHLAAQDDNLKY